jgi:hypothetical protein
MKTPTIYEVKSKTGYYAPHFFDRETLKFFGQTMKSFKVQKSPADRIFIYAPSYQCIRGKTRLMGYTFREVVGNDLVMPRWSTGDMVKHDTLSDVLHFIENN